MRLAYGIESIGRRMGVAVTTKNQTTGVPQFLILPPESGENKLEIWMPDTFFQVCFSTK